MEVMGQNQKKFQRKLIAYKNKDFIDTISQKKQIQQLRKKRRITSQTHKVKKNFQISFINTQEVRSSKLQQSIKKFVARCQQGRSFYSLNSDPKTDKSTTSLIFISFTNKRGIPINKQLDRNSFIQLKNEPSSERIFHNFQQLKPDLKHTFNMGKITFRKQQYKSLKIADLSYDTQKIYNDLYFKSDTFKCLFSYKKQNPISQQQFIKSNNVFQMSNQLEPTKIKHAFQLTMPNTSRNILQFYRSSGRQYPPSNLIKTINQLQNFWQINGKFIKKQQDSIVKNFKHKLLKKRIQQRKNKILPLNPNEYCIEIQMRRGI